jgi:hypothetical protein
MSPSPTHNGAYGGQYRVVEWWALDTDAPQRRATPVFGVSQSVANDACRAFAATAEAGHAFVSHPAGPLKPPVAPKAARQPKPKQVTKLRDGAVVYGRGRRDLRGLNPQQKAEHLYPSTEARCGPNNTTMIHSPVSGNVYTVDEALNCNCGAYRRCWHSHSAEMKAERGDILPMEEEDMTR